MEWAIENDADVLSLSIGAEEYTTEFIDPIRNAEANGVTVVISSGNVGADASTSPGNIYDAFSVGASDSNRAIPPFSGGEVIDTETAWGADAPEDWPMEYVAPNVVAPGLNINSASPGDEYASLSGTSMAAPHVAGALAVIQSGTDEHHSSDELRAALEATAWKPPSWATPADIPDTRYGYGIIDVYAATAELRGETVEPALSLRNVTLDQPTILEGDSTTVSGTVENTGTATGTFTAALRIDGVVKATQSVVIGPSKTEQVIFTPSFSTSGNYDITVNDTRAGTLKVEKPAIFKVSEVTVDSDSITEGDSVTVSATVQNIGDREGTFVADFGIDGNTVQTREVTISDKEATEISFEHSFDEAGEYDLTLGGVEAGSLVVKTTPAFEVQNVTLNQDTITAGESVTVTATVQNVGGSVGDFTGELTVDGETVQTRSQSIAEGETATISFVQPFDIVGEYTLAVNGTTGGTLTVEDPTSVAIKNATISPETILEGEAVTVSAIAENTGNEIVEFLGELRLDGAQVATQSVTLESGENETISHTHTVSEAGAYSVSINRTQIGTLQVDRPATFEVRDLAVSETPTQVGETVTVTATVENVGDRAGRFQGVLEANGTEIGTHSRFLVSGVSRTLSFDVAFDTPGAYTLTVQDAEPLVLTVEGADDPVAPYRDDDGVVETSDLRDAIDDWREEQISTDLLRDVIDAWRSSR